MIDGRRRDLFANRQNRDARLKPAGAAQQMPGHGLGGTDRQLVGMVAERALDGHRLQLVAELGRSAMRVDIADLFRLDPRVAQGIAHHAERAFAIFGRRGDVKGIGAHAVADNLGQNRRAAPLCEFQFLDNQNARAFADDKSVAVLVPGTAGPLRLVVALESARMAAKPPTPIGVMQASVPPQIIASASPRWMIL